MRSYIHFKSGFILFCACVALSIIGCKKEEVQLNRAELIGTWQLVEQDIDLTDGEAAHSVNGYAITFKADSTFESGKYKGCAKGTFRKLDDQRLAFYYDCAEKEKLAGKGTQVEEFELENGFMYFTPKYLNCIEGCYFKFKKISD